MNSRATFLTPSYVKDLERFTLLRESMERCEIDIPHTVVVQHEDVPLFEKIPFQHKLTILSTKDVLPAAIEARRTARGYPRKHPYHWIKPKPLHGWSTQQLVKLSSPAFVDTEGILCLDSDVFFVGQVTQDEFFAPDGRLHLYETDELTVETVTWMAQSMQTLKVSQGHRPAQYINNPTPLHRDVVLGLQACLEKLHGKSWIDVFLEHNLTEYMTYGVYARYVDGLERVFPTLPTFTLNHWVPGDIEDIEHSLPRQIEQTGAKLILISANIGRPVASYRQLAEQAWAAKGKA